LFVAQNFGEAFSSCFAAACGRTRRRSGPRAPSCRGPTAASRSPRAASTRPSAAASSRSNFCFQLAAGSAMLAIAPTNAWKRSERILDLRRRATGALYAAGRCCGGAAARPALHGGRWTSFGGDRALVIQSSATRAQGRRYPMGATGEDRCRPRCRARQRLARGRLRASSRPAGPKRHGEGGRPGAAERHRKERPRRREDGGRQARGAPSRGGPVSKAACLSTWMKPLSTVRKPACATIRAARGRRPVGRDSFFLDGGGLWWGPSPRRETLRHRGAVVGKLDRGSCRGGDRPARRP